MDNSYHKQLEILNQDVNLFVEKYELLKEELRLQKLENLELTKLVKEQNEQLNDFNNRDKIAKLVDRVASDEEERKELKSKINQYIRLIDECLARLEE